MKFALLSIFISGFGTLWAGDNVWTSIGPEGGRVQALAIDPKEPSTVYAASIGGIFKTTDAGASWKPANSGLPVGYTAGTLAIDPQNSGTVYAAFGSGGVYKNILPNGTWSLYFNQNIHHSGDGATCPRLRDRPRWAG